jgi:outer membrane protein OmpA-like peptidoglycan-associated protein
VVIAQQPVAKTVVMLPKMSADELQPEELPAKDAGLVTEPVAEPVAGAVFVPALIPKKFDPVEYTRSRISKFDPLEYTRSRISKFDTAEYTLSRASGITPLYGIKLKGQVPVVTSPERVEETKVAAYRKFRLPDNLFEFDNTELIPEVQKSLTELSELMRSDKNWVFMLIDGHTDAIGSVKYNMDLSLKRAVSVANYLINREGFDPSRIFVRGMGKTAPIADNTTDEGRKLNRRFEIILLVHKEKTR